MNGILARGRRRLAWLGAALVVSSLFLGGCVAETEDGEDEAVAQVGAADSFDPKLPNKPGGATPSDNAGNASVPIPPGGDPTNPNPDPDPNPWYPWHNGSGAVAH